MGVAADPCKICVIRFNSEQVHQTQELAMENACEPQSLEALLGTLSGWPLAFAVVGLAFAFVFLVRGFW
jgi:hypothetical protein